MADAEARRAAIQKASVQVRTGSAFVRRAQPQTITNQPTKQPSHPPDRKRG
jgi:hypothetical protein